jgi:hypothetical protein
MNERIKQLALQAQKVVGYTDGGYTEIKALDQEKFAELIVKECCDIVRQCRFAPDEDAIVNEIVHHFGVEL